MNIKPIINDNLEYKKEKENNNSKINSEQDLNFLKEFVFLDFMNLDNEEQNILNLFFSDNNTSTINLEGELTNIISDLSENFYQTKLINEKNFQTLHKSIENCIKKNNPIIEEKFNYKKIKNNVVLLNQKILGMYLIMSRINKIN